MGEPPADVGLAEAFEEALSGGELLQGGRGFRLEQLGVARGEAGLGLGELRPFLAGEVEGAAGFVESRREVARVPEDGEKAEAARSLEAPVARRPRAIEGLAKERRRLLGALAPALQLSESDEARVDPAGEPDGPGRLERATEVLLGGGDVAQLEVEESDLVERLDPLAREPRRLVARERRADEVDPLAVAARLEEERPLSLEPVGFLLLQPGLAGEREGAVEVRGGLRCLARCGRGRGRRGPGSSPPGFRGAG